MTEDINESDDTYFIPIINQEADLDIVKKIVEFCDYYTNNDHSKLDELIETKPLKSAKLNDLVDQWY